MFCPDCGKELDLFMGWSKIYKEMVARKIGCHNYQAVAGCAPCNKVYGLKGSKRKKKEEIEIIAIEVLPHSYSEANGAVPTK